MSQKMIAEIHDLTYPIFVFVYTVVRISFVLFVKVNERATHTRVSQSSEETKLQAAVLYNMRI